MSTKGSDFQEELLVGFLQSAHRRHHRYGAMQIASNCDTPHAKLAVAKFGGTRRLVALLKKYADESVQRHRQTILALMHALLNLSTHHKNQEIAGMHGCDLISELATLDHLPDIQGFAARILKNLSRFGANRTRLYKAELRIKADKWHREACNAVNPDTAAELEESIAKSGLWHTVAKDGLGVPEARSDAFGGRSPLAQTPLAHTRSRKSVGSTRRRKTSGMAWRHEGGDSRPPSAGVQRRSRPSSAAATYRSTVKPQVDVDVQLRNAAIAAQRSQQSLRGAGAPRLAAPRSGSVSRGFGSSLGMHRSGSSPLRVLTPVLDAGAADRAVQLLRRQVEEEEQRARRKQERAYTTPPQHVQRLQQDYMMWCVLQSHCHSCRWAAGNGGSRVGCLAMCMCLWWAPGTNLCKARHSTRRASRRAQAAGTVAAVATLLPAVACALARQRRLACLAADSRTRLRRHGQAYGPSQL